MSETGSVWVYVLDMVGYDVRGGAAEVFATAEAAMASLPKVHWVETADGWEERDSPGALGDLWVIYKREVQGDGA